MQTGNTSTISQPSLGVARATATIAGCVCIAFCEGFDLQAAGVAAGGIVAEFAPTPNQLGTFFSASTLGLCVGALFGGRLSDSYGRKRALVGSLVLFGVFSLLTAAAPGIQLLNMGSATDRSGSRGGFPQSSGPGQ